MKKWLFISIVTLLVLLLVAGGVVHYLVTRSDLPRQEVALTITEETGLLCEIESGYLNWSGQFTGHNIILRLPDGTLVAEIERAVLQLPPTLQIIFGGEPDASAITLHGAHLHIESEQENRWPLIDHFEALAAADDSPDQPLDLMIKAPLLRFSLHMHERETQTIEGVDLQLEPDGEILKLMVAGEDRFLLLSELDPITLRPRMASLAGSALQGLARLIDDQWVEKLSGQLVWTPIADPQRRAAAPLWAGQLEGDLDGILRGPRGPIVARLQNNRINLHPDEIEGRATLFFQGQRLQAIGEVALSNTSTRWLIEPRNLAMSLRGTDERREARVTRGAVIISESGVQISQFHFEGFDGEVTVDAWWPYDTDITLASVGENADSGPITDDEIPETQTFEDIVEVTPDQPDPGDQTAEAPVDLIGPPVWAPADIDLPWHTIRGEIQFTKVDLAQLSRLIPELQHTSGGISGSVAWQPINRRYRDEPVIIARLQLSGDTMAHRTIRIDEIDATAYLAHSRAYAPNALIRLADGSLTSTVRLRREAGDTRILISSTLDRLDYAQLIKSWDDKTREAAGRLSGTMELNGPLAEWQTFTDFTGSAELQLRESNLADTRLFGALYTVLSLNINTSRKEGTGDALLRLEGPELHFDRVQYFNRGAAIYLTGRIHDLMQGAESQISGTAFGAAEPLQGIPIIGDIASLVSRLQGVLTAVELSGQLNDPQTKAVPFRPAVDIFTGIIRGFNRPNTQPARDQSEDE